MVALTLALGIYRGFVPTDTQTMVVAEPGPTITTMGLNPAAFSFSVITEPSDITEPMVCSGGYILPERSLASGSAGFAITGGVSPKSFPADCGERSESTAGELINILMPA